MAWISSEKKDIDKYQIPEALGEVEYIEGTLSGIRAKQSYPVVVKTDKGYYRKDSSSSRWERI